MILYDIILYYIRLHTPYIYIYIVPQQRKLMGSSAKNSSGVHWCRCRVRFNDIVKKVPKVGRLWCRARSRSTGFRRRFRGRPGSGAEPGQAQQGSGKGSGEGRARSGEGSGEGLGSFGAEPGQVQQRSGEGSGEGLGGLGRARSGSTGFRRRFRRRSGRLWCKARSGSTGFWRRFRRRF